MNETLQTTTIWLLLLIKIKEGLFQKKFQVIFMRAAITISEGIHCSFLLNRIMIICNTESRSNEKIQETLLCCHMCV